MLIGYARVSTADQDLTLQLDALTAAGCDKIFTDKGSGTKANRDGLTEAIRRMSRSRVFLAMAAMAQVKAVEVALNLKFHSATQARAEVISHQDFLRPTGE